MKNRAKPTLMKALRVMSLATDGPTFDELMIEPPSRMSGFLKAFTSAWLTKLPFFKAV